MLLLSPTTGSTEETMQRYENESFAAYKQRRAASNAEVRAYSRDLNHGATGSRQKYRDEMRRSGAMGKRIRAADALVAAWAQKRVSKEMNQGPKDERGAYTLTGRNLPVYGMNAWDRDRIVGWTPGRRVWTAGIGAHGGA